MNYSEALSFIHSIPKFRRPLGNADLGRLLAVLGNPQKCLKFVHIAGTNGKGSIAAMTAEILARAGYKTGLFTSPYIEVFNERIRVNGENIADGDLASYASRVRDAMEGSGAYVSEFAFVTAAAFLYFYEQKCDIVMLEVGMGGKLDATNVIDESCVSVICKIGLDHTLYLGNTIEEIAKEKCGIIRENGIVVSYPNGEASDIIKNCCEEKNASLVFAGAPEITENGFIYKGKEYALSLAGTYQPQNAAVTLEVINALRGRGFEIPESAVEDGLKNTRHAARFEFLADDLIIDGAHNIDAMRALKKSLLALNREIVLVTAMMEDKDFDACMREIAPIAKEVICTELDIPRCVEAQKLAAVAESAGTSTRVITEPSEAVRYALEAAQGGIVCACGSLYLAGEVRKKFVK